MKHIDNNFAIIDFKFMMIDYSVHRILKRKTCVRKSVVTYLHQT